TLLTNPGVQIVSILVGIAVLIAGRRLFWLFVGAVGFVVGLSLAFQLLTDQPTWVILVAASILGLIGIVAAIFVQTAAVGIAGFLIGGYALVWLLQRFGLALGEWGWLIYIIAGILGAILALYLFETALVILSSLAGATLIVQATHFDALVTAILFIILLVAGILIQTKTGRARDADSETAE
ncbi:MAG: hypothetical protein HYR94_27220, partial [Chloroflexi bacterium]|nr:hypothetical protein [Chloroflexota bacterium]